jgi:hypothetical protein
MGGRGDLARGETRVTPWDRGLGLTQNCPLEWLISRSREEFSESETALDEDWEVLAGSSMSLDA